MTPTREYDICSLGAALVDVFFRVSDEELTDLGLEKGATTHVDSRRQGEILLRLREKSASRSPGGSGANSIRVAARLGSRTALVTLLGDDDPGRYFKSELAALGIEAKGPLLPGGTTGTCVCILTPDAERTLCTDLGVSARISAEHVDEDVIKHSRWLLLEGYLLVNPGQGDCASRRALQCARRHGTRVAMGISACSVVRRFRETLAEIVDGADVVFANEEEALAYTGASTSEDALRSLSHTTAGNQRLAVVTAGAGGAWVVSSGDTFHSPAVPSEPVDVTGAGDAFAGAFLHGIARGLAPREAARGANLLAGMVVTRWGADPGEDTLEAWGGRRGP